MADRASPREVVVRAGPDGADATLRDDDLQSGHGHAFGSVTVPARSLLERETQDAVATAEQVGFESTIRLEPVEVWSLPILIDAALGRYVPPFDFNNPFLGHIDFRGSTLPPRGPSAFAQYVVFSPVIPFEESPPKGTSLAEVILAAGGSAGVGVGFYATGDPLVLIVVPAGIIVCGAAAGISQALRIGLRARLLEKMGWKTRTNTGDDGRLIYQTFAAFPAT